MAYDLLIKNGLVVDGSGMPAFRGDVGVRDGKIAEIGKLSGPATRTVDAERARGFSRLHRQPRALRRPGDLGSAVHVLAATWLHDGDFRQLLIGAGAGAAGPRSIRTAEFLSYVEAIPMEVLNTIDVDWETIPQYMDKLDKTLGVNAGTLIGHTPVRHYVMGDECQKRDATDDGNRRHAGRRARGMTAGALGLSLSRQKGHFDPQGVPIPALWADDKEIFALADVLRELSTGTIQVGGGVDQELKDGMMARLAEATGRTVVYNNLARPCAILTSGRATWRASMRRWRKGSGPIRCAAPTG